MTGHDPPRVGTRPYGKFVDELRLALLNPHPSESAALLDGSASARCRELVPEATIHRLGAFFTPSRIARRAASALVGAESKDAMVFDPACGAADLLLPIAGRLSVRRTVSSTLEYWNERLSGCDLSAEFIQAARLRMVLLALRKGAVLDDTPDALADVMSNLLVADGLSVSTKYEVSSHIIMNPPYSRLQSERRPWRDGTITAAALFVERAARLSAPGAQIVAVLPEVLRGGSSYANWRRHIDQYVLRARPLRVGLFSDHADVDVFIQRLTRRLRQKPRSPRANTDHHRCLGSHFIVSVGAVVPHRHSKTGPAVAYLHVGNTSPWVAIRRIDESRRFRGRLFTPPFVVIRRTSRPGDSYRATGSLVLGKRPVAVENHLIVLAPRRGGASICRTLIRLLRLPRTNAFLNRTMRCRHLTTASVASLPWPYGCA